MFNWVSADDGVEKIWLDQEEGAVGALATVCSSVNKTMHNEFMVICIRTHETCFSVSSPLSLTLFPRTLGKVAIPDGVGCRRLW